MRYAITRRIAVAIIMTFLASCSSLSECRSKSRSSYGADGIGSLNRAQQAYHFEKQAFADSVYIEHDLGVILPSDYFSFSIQATDNAAFSYAIPKETHSYLESYVGAVIFDPTTSRYESISCKDSSLELEKLSKPIIQDGQLSCGEGMEKLS